MGEEGVPKSNEVNTLQKGAGLKSHLKHKGYFEHCPHQLRAILITATVLFAIWCAPQLILGFAVVIVLIVAAAIAIVARILSFGDPGSAE